MSLIFGLFAALAWGLHDLCVRFAAPGRPVLPLLAVVLASGAVPLLALSGIEGGWPQMTPRAGGLSLAAGLAFALANISLYNAFAIGPVALVAPIFGAYPALTLLHAAATGRPAGPDQIAAVAAIILGVALVARFSQDTTADPARKRQAILWACAGAFAFAATFALSQAAGRAGGADSEWATIALTRLSALVVVILVVLPRLRHAFRAPMPWRLLLAMGLLDAGALSAVSLAARLPHPEFAAVTASVFGVVTILLARLVLGEHVRASQWAAIAMVFAAIAWLGL